MKGITIYPREITDIIEKDDLPAMTFIAELFDRLEIEVYLLDEDFDILTSEDDPYYIRKDLNGKSYLVNASHMTNALWLTYQTWPKSHPVQFDNDEQFKEYVIRENLHENQLITLIRLGYAVEIV